MPKASPDQIAANWASRLAASGQKIQQGVDAVTVAPQQKAVQAADKWLAKLNDPATMAKYKASLSRSGLQDWQSAMKAKGIPRIASGANQSQAKVASFWGQFGPFLDSVTSRVRAMPSNNLEDNIARVTAQIRGVAQFKRS